MPTEIKNLLEKAHISLLLDSYDALFSDFDPRPYAERAISDDFLLEIKRAVREAKPGVFEMGFLIPKHLKNAHEEEIIRERLHHYFHKQTMDIIHEAKGIIGKAVLYVFVGFLLMFGASYIDHELTSIFLLNFVKIVIEPAGWFLVWYGFDQIFYDAKSRKPEVEFNRKMSHADIHFDTY